jgi:hypothetical protein
VPVSRLGATESRRGSQGTRQRLRIGPRRAFRDLPVLVRVLVLVVLVSPLFALPFLRGDGNGYYAWVRSPVIDHNLDFENEFLRADPSFLNAVSEDGELRPDMYTENGRVRNQWGVGPAIIWAPFVLVAHGVVLAGRAVGIGWPADGYSLPYLWTSAVVTALAASIGLLLSLRVAMTLARTGPAVVGTTAIWLASSLPIYQYLLPFWPFGIAVLVSSVLVWVWHRPGWTASRWLALGALCGFAVSVHPVGVTWSVLPVASLLGLDRGTFGERSRALGWFALGGLAGLIPQLIGKAIVNDSPFDTGYRVSWRFLDPDVFRVLFGADHGAFSWTPVLFLALIGLAIVVRRDRRLGIGLLVVFAAMAYLIASYGSYEQSSFGNRFLLWFTPGFVIGASALADAAWSRRSLVIGLTSFLVLWNVLFMFQWAWGLAPKRGPVDWGVVARQQVTEAPEEMMRAVRLFFTDRGELIRIVQEADAENISSGGG